MNTGQEIRLFVYPWQNTHYQKNDQSKQFSFWCRQTGYLSFLGTLLYFYTLMTFLLKQCFGSVIHTIDMTT